MRINNKKISDAFLIFIVLFACCSEFLAFDIHLPYMPEMGVELHTTKFMIQLIFILSLCESWVFQLFWGQISDAYGRRNIALISMFFALVGQLGCIFAQSISVLLLFRALQYFFVGGMWSGIIGVLVDKFGEKKKLARVFSFIDLLYPLTIMIAPVLGAFLGGYVGWRGNFAFLFLIQLIATVLVFLYLPETILKKSKLTFQKALGSYKEIITNKKFMRLNVIICLLYAPITLFTAHSPYIYIEYFNFSQQKFSLFQALPMLISFCSTLIYVNVIKKINLNIAIKYGVYVVYLFCISCTLLILGVFSCVAIYLAIIVSLISFACSFIRPSMESQLYTIFKEKAASAMAVNIASFSLIVTPITMICAAMFDGSPKYVLWWMLLPGVVISVLCFKDLREKISID